MQGTRDAPYQVVDVESIDVSQIETVPSQQGFIDLISRSMEFFFSTQNNSFRDLYGETTNFPFKGFIFAGPPGTGKTEAVRLAFYQQYLTLSRSGQTLRLFHVNAADINRSAVGDIEQRLRRVFRDATSPNTNHRTIVLFDDIDSLLVRRTERNASEWSRAANGVFFQEVDKLDASKVLIMATTNQPELIDGAVHSRLTLRHVEPPTLEDMLAIAARVFPPTERGMRGLSRADLLEEVKGRMVEAMQRADDPEAPSFRLARKTGIEVFMTHIMGWE